jgi:uncharacterized spore protein YtfJ
MDLHALLGKATDSMGVGRAFGTAYERGEMLVIPVAFVAGGRGAGSSEPDPADASGATGTDSRMGTGFGSVSWPLGVYVVSDGKVRWVPAFDTTLIALAGIGLAKLALRLLSRRAPSRR